MPSDAPEIVAKVGDKLLDLLLSAKIIPSKTEFRRLVREGAVSIVETGEKIDNPDFAITKPLDVRVGKKRFVKIRI